MSDTSETQQTEGYDGGLMGFAQSLGEATVGNLATHGERGGFVQAFDVDPATSDPSSIAIDREHLDRTAARNLLGARIESGFAGFAGFTYIGQRDGFPSLELEVVDAAAGKGLMLSLKLKRTLTGKYKPAVARAELIGFPEPFSDEHEVPEARDANAAREQRRPNVTDEPSSATDSRAEAEKQLEREAMRVADELGAIPYRKHDGSWEVSHKKRGRKTEIRFWLDDHGNVQRSTS